MEHAELVVRNHGGSTPFPELHAALMYVLPTGERVCLMSTTGCVKNPEVVERYVVNPLGELGVPVVRDDAGKLPADDTPRLLSTNEQLQVENEGLKKLVMALSERCLGLVQVVARSAERNSPCETSPAPPAERK